MSRDLGCGLVAHGYDRTGRSPPETCGEILDAYGDGPAPKQSGPAPRPAPSSPPRCVHRNIGALRKACLLAAWFLIALWFAWFKFGDHGLGDVVGMLAFLSPTFVPVGFILYGSLAGTTRRPVPRLPWRGRRSRATQDAAAGVEGRRA